VFCFLNKYPIREAIKALFSLSLPPPRLSLRFIFIAKSNTTRPLSFKRGRLPLYQKNFLSQRIRLNPLSYILEPNHYIRHDPIAASSCLWPSSTAQFAQFTPRRPHFPQSFISSSGTAAASLPYLSNQHKTHFSPLLSLALLFSRALTANQTNPNPVKMSDREKKRVNFRDSPPGGSRSSCYTSDSGVGSLSDHASRPDPRTASHDIDQWNDLGALQEAYRDVYESKEHYKKKARELDAEATQARKNFKEADQKWKTLVDLNDDIEKEKQKIFKDKKALEARVDGLQGENETLRSENETLRKDLAKLNQYIEQMRRSNSPPAPPEMSGGNPDAAAKLKRSSSKHREKRRDKEEEEKKRLSQRFERKEGDNRSDSTNSSSSKPPSSSNRSRRMSKSYIEPFGPGPKQRPPPPSPTRGTNGNGRAHYDNYTQSSLRPPTYATSRDTSYSDVPRSIPPPSVHPAVYAVTVADDPSVEYVDPALTQGFLENGDYFPYPVPKDHRSKPSR
jgi:hypothetical protein